MAQFGAGVNPSLGAIDYSAYSQGAAQGSAAIGKGIASLGEHIGQGVREFYKKKEEKELNAQADSFVHKFLKENPEAAASMGIKPDAAGVYDPALIKNISKMFGGPGEAIKAITTVDQHFKDQKQKKAEEKSIAVGLASLNAGVSANPLEAIQITGNVVTPGVASYFANLENVNSQSAERRAQAAARLNPVAKQPSTYHSVRSGMVAAFRQANGREPNAIELSSIDEKAAKAGSASTIVDMGGNAFDKRASELSVNRFNDEYTAAEAAPELVRKMDEVDNLLSKGNAITGVFADTILDVRRIQSGLGNAEARKKVTDTQVLDSLRGTQFIKSLQASGLASRNFDTEKERQFWFQAITGDKTFDAEALRELIRIRRGDVVISSEKFMKRQEKGVYDKFYEKTGFPKIEFGFLSSAARDARIEELQAKAAPKP